MRLSINAEDLSYRELNLKVRKFLNGNNSDNGSNRKAILRNVLGQRYIGDGLKGNVSVNIYGTPGNDLGAFMDGPVIEVFGNGQDGTGNTMNSGKIIIHGSAGDITGYSMRGGEIYIEKNIGFRGGIHMKSYQEKIPVIVVGGSTGDFLGEYMAGGIIIILGLYGKERISYPFYNFYSEGRGIIGNYTGAGMHGGIIYVRGNVKDYKLGKEVKKAAPNRSDIYLLNKYIKNYNKFFNSDRVEKPVDSECFTKLIPYSHRPYGKLYAY